MKAYVSLIALIAIIAGAFFLAVILKQSKDEQQVFAPIEMIQEVIDNQ